MTLQRQAFFSTLIISLIFVISAGFSFQYLVQGINERAAEKKVKELGDKWVEDLDRAATQLKSIAELIARDEMTHRYFGSTQNMEDVNFYPAYTGYIASVLAVFPQAGEISILFLDGTEDIRVAFGVGNNSQNVNTRVFKDMSVRKLDEAVGVETNEDFEASVLVYYQALKVNSRINTVGEPFHQRVGYIRVLVPLDTVFVASRSGRENSQNPIIMSGNGRILYSGTHFELMQYLLTLGLDSRSGWHYFQSRDWLIDVRRWRPDIEVVVSTEAGHGDNQMRTSILLMSVTALVLLVLVPLTLAVLLNRWVLNPLVSLVRAAKDTNYTIPKSQLSRSDEIGILVRAFVSMRGDLIKQNVKLKSQVYKDGLTGLPNRNALPHLLENCIEHSVDDFALLFLDLDGFKKINDAYGHAQGDQLLKAVSERILSVLRVNDSIVHYLGDDLVLDPSLVRLGGDEFTIILPRIGGAANAKEVAMRIVSSIRQPFKLDDIEIFVGASIGISIYPLHTKNLDELIKFADFAMYEAKSRGKMQAVLFESKFEQSESALLEIEQAVAFAIENDEVETWFQPKVNPKTQQIEGFEALVRINSEKFGFLFPDKFIPIAERNHLIDRITLIVVKSCCRLHKHIQVEYESSIPMSINLSPVQIERSDLFEKINDIVSLMSVDKVFLEFEVTETLIMQNEKSGRERLRDLRAQGYRTSLDDFGVGYSSLSYLKKFEFDVLKIDRSFFKDVDYDETSQAILKSIQELARNLDMRVVAEGIETAEQLDLVTDLGVDLIQGYFFSKPLHEGDILTFMKLFQRTSKHFAKK